jgi:hypothetical protein
MTTQLFSPLPDDSRLWLFALDRALDAASTVKLEAGLNEIFGNWRHKGHAYEAAWELMDGRILAVVEPSMASSPSGCAIDGMLRKVQRVASESGAALIDESSVVLRVGEALRSLPKTELGAALERGELDAATPVVDLALFTLGQLREGLLEKPLARTWIGRKFKVAATA